MKFQKYLKESQENSIRKKIIEYFTNNKHPDDEQIHKFAEDNKINKHELEDNIYAILSDFLYNGRYNQSKNKESIKFDPEQIKMGIKVESEHVGNAKDLAERITKDHLSEYKFYYTELAKMEKTFKD